MIYSEKIELLLESLDNKLRILQNGITGAQQMTPAEAHSTLEDGKQQLTLSVLGHDVKNIKLEVTEDKVVIKAKKEEGTSPLVEDIDATFSVGKDYDGTKVDAKFTNGLLILTIDKKEERKSKSIQIKVG